MSSSQGTRNGIRPPPAYSPPLEPTSTEYDPYHDGETSETTPLVARRDRKCTSQLVCFLVTMFLFTFILTFLSWFVCIMRISAERQQWELELTERRLQEQVRIKDWEDEVKGRQERERQREEQWQHEEEERERLGLYWGNLEAGAHCSGYQTRYYRAPLLNTVPYQYNWLKPCMDLPIVIHGRSVNATTCEIMDDGSVYGHWEVNFDEPVCTPYWVQFEDKGCTAPGSGRHRFTARLENIHWREDGEKLCAAAPHDFLGMHFDKPLTCTYWDDYEVFGIWEADDNDC